MLFPIQVEPPRDLARDSGQRKLTYSLQNHCASSTEIKKAVIVTIIKSSNYNSYYILYLSYLSCTFKTTHKLSFLIANLID